VRLEQLAPFPFDLVCRELFRCGIGFDCLGHVSKVNVRVSVWARVSSSTASSRGGDLRLWHTLTPAHRRLW
jgi:hypothetical protein